MKYNPCNNCTYQLRGGGEKLCDLSRSQVQARKAEYCTGQTPRGMAKEAGK